MKKLIGSLFFAMITVAVVYCNYHAIKESVPFLRRQCNRFAKSKLVTMPKSWLNRVTSANIVVATKTKAKDAGGRVVHMFKRSETA